MTDLPLVPDGTTTNGITNGAANGTANGNHSRSPHHQVPNEVTTHSPMYISGIGSILAMHFPPTSPHLPSLFYHHMLSRDIYLAERGFIALNIELGTKEVQKFAEATGEFVEKYKSVILTC